MLGLLEVSSPLKDRPFSFGKQDNVEVTNIAPLIAKNVCREALKRHSSSRPSLLKKGRGWFERED